MSDAEANEVVQVKTPETENGSMVATVDTLTKMTLSESSFKTEATEELDETDEGPPEVQRRIKALKNIQLETAKTESAFFKEMHDLEMKYSKMYTDFYDKRREIILGKYEPTDEECVFNCGGSAEEEATEKNANEEKNLGEALKKPDLVEQSTEGEESAVTGIPDFWLTIFQNVELLSELIQDHDVPILKHLIDIKVEMTKKPMGFKLHFHFSPNENFKNAVLTKTYEMKCEIDSDDPFSFEGPEIIKCSGCSIDWNEGKNVTVKVVRKKQKHKQTGSIRLVNKNVDVPSFFDFFNPPQVEEGVELDDEAQSRLTNHFELGQYIRERIVPRAVLYYTGEALDDEDDDDDEYDDSDEDDTDREDEEKASARSTESHGGEGENAVDDE